MEECAYIRVGLTSNSRGDQNHPPHKVGVDSLRVSVYDAWQACRFAFRRGEKRRRSIESMVVPPRAHSHSLLYWHSGLHGGRSERIRARYSTERDCHHSSDEASLPIANGHWDGWRMSAGVVLGLAQFSKKSVGIVLMNPFTTGGAHEVSKFARGKVERGFGACAGSPSGVCSDDGVDGDDDGGVGHAGDTAGRVWVTLWTQINTDSAGMPRTKSLAMAGVGWEWATLIVETYTSGMDGGHS